MKCFVHSLLFSCRSTQHQLAGGNIFKNDGSFLEKFQKSQGQLSSTIINNDTQQVY